MNDADSPSNKRNQDSKADKTKEDIPGNLIARN
jgi:hypothetical protein